jgi:hypothetical protein
VRARKIETWWGVWEEYGCRVASVWADREKQRGAGLPISVQSAVPPTGIGACIGA